MLFFTREEKERNHGEALMQRIPFPSVTVYSPNRGKWRAIGEALKHLGQKWQDYMLSCRHQHHHLGLHQQQVQLEPRPYQCDKVEARTLGNGRRTLWSGGRSLKEQRPGSGQHQLRRSHCHRDHLRRQSLKAKVEHVGGFSACLFLSLWDLTLSAKKIFSKSQDFSSEHSNPLPTLPQLPFSF